MDKAPIRILFLCVANSARSQLAEVLAKNIFKDRALIQSAGSNPSGIVNPMALQVLEEEGLDTSKQSSKAIEDLPAEFLQSLDYVVTLCAEEVCPTLPTKAKRLHWPIVDPSNAAEANRLMEFRRAKREIEERLIIFARSFD